MFSLRDDIGNGEVGIGFTVFNGLELKGVNFIVLFNDFFL